MKIQWTLAAVLSSALIVGCSDKSTENTPNPQETGTEAAATQTTGEVAAVPAEPSPSSDASAVPNQAPARTSRPARQAPAQANRPGFATPGTAAPSESRPATSAPSASAAAPAAPAPPPSPRFHDATATAGTALALELITPISSETAQVETPVSARLTQPLRVNGDTVVPAGAVLHGNVTAVERPGRVRGVAHLAFRFTEVEVNGTRDELRTNLLNFEGQETKGEDATKVGAGAGVGAIIGGIVGGGSGAAKGAIIGGAAGTGAVLATRGKEVSLASGTSLTASLAQPFTVRVRD